MGETRGDHSIDIAINSEDESFKPYIFKVPTILRRHNPKSFTPNSFSFGPLHHEKEHLKETEEIKKQYLANLLFRKPTPHTTLEKFKRSILELEGIARKCYAFPTDHLDEDQFVDMLVLDGCFIIELLRKNEIINNGYNNTLDEDDPVFSVGWALQVLYHDLILLENQIPWFVLELLFEMTSVHIPSFESLTQLALDFFGTIFSWKARPSIPRIFKINHIPDLIRNLLDYSPGTRQISPGKWHQIPTATSLNESGIRFKRGEFSKLMDLKFVIKYGILEMPPLLIQDTTCVAFRNIISYEQCYSNCEPKITSYAIFLSNLINTAKDIEVLHEAGLVDNWMNPNDTLELFKNIYTDTYVKKFYYVKICQDVNEYRDRFLPRFRAAYVRAFWDPIGCLSLFGGIALILTFLQTLYTILQYNKDSSPSLPPPS